MFRSAVLWEIRHHTEYRQNHPAGDGDGELHAGFYLQVDAEGRAGEGFRIPLSGGHIIRDIWGKELFEEEDMQQYRFRYEMDPSMIEIRPNTTVSAWEDCLFSREVDKTKAELKEKPSNMTGGKPSTFKHTNVKLELTS